MRVDQAAPLVGVPWGGLDETIGSHLALALARLPEPGEEFDIDGTRVEIEAVEGGAITSVIFGNSADDNETK